jgi:hypothetical protein
LSGVACAGRKVGCDVRVGRALACHASLLAAFTLVARADTYFLTVAGVGGEQEYEQRFSGWAKDLDKVVREEPGAKVETLTGKDATKANVEAKLRTIAAQAKADDSVVVTLIGHGTYDDRDYKFALPGPDISGTELAQLLDRIQARVLVVNTTSSSGGSIPILQKGKRVVITATKTGTEKNVTVFARYWIEALRDPAADTDKNGIITALEAFKYAQAKTDKYFEGQNWLSTEHCLLEDSGRGDGVKDPGPENGEGQTAGRFALLHLGAVAAVVNDPKKQELLKKKEELETQIDDLKYHKAAMDTQQYQTELRKLLLDLAQTQGELDK